jgi:hypothetical protein
MKKIKPILTGLGIVLLVALVSFVVWSSNNLARDRVTLPDGTTIELLGTAVGTRTFSTEKPWEAFARRILPSRLQSWIPQALRSSCYSGSNSVTVFFRVTAPAGKTISQPPWTGYVPVDSTGYYVSSGGSSSCSSGSGPEMIYGLMLNNLPRRQKDFEFRFLGPTNLLASFNVPTPAQAPFTEWTPNRLPITQTNGPLTVTLESLAEAGANGYRSLNAQWKVVSSDPLWKNAKPGWISVSDATGNEGSFLYPGEPAWKLTTLVHRPNPEDFTDAEKFTLSGLKVPAPGEITSINQSRTAAGVKIDVELLSAVGRLSVTNGLPPVLAPNPIGGSSGGSGSDGTTHYRYWTSEHPALLIHAAGIGPDDELRCIFRGPNGEEFKTENSGYETDASGRREYLLKAAGPITTETLSLEVFVSRPLKFEFMVDPKVIRAAAR